ncbi:Tubulin delta chain [Holothuria leucospilota]|uniref:Tubulin delta chain n=1 Tax=Holothuria leucospilota TaxID=206669 RepID=A0A9Q1BAZ2_HOLLE|nr:Tubulin delta chain [Holothuria leucospilota]
MSNVLWYAGYYGYSGSESYNLLEEALETIRKQIERCDAFSGFILMQSLAGGTGSGLGSHLIEKLRDEFGLAYILSVAVSPFSSGESPLQYYNTILTTSWLQRYCDGILLFQNNDILQSLINIASANLKSSSFVSVSMNDLNQKIAYSLASLIQPIDALNPTNGILSEQEPWELLRSVCPMPACKFMSIHHTVQSKLSWERITKSLLHSMRKYSASGEPFSSISSLVVVRGDSHNTFPASIPAIEKAILSSCHCVPWNPFPVDFWQGTKHFHLKPSEASVTLCSNSTSVAELLQTSLDKAKAMFMAKGYLHWYARYGCTEEVFEDAFEVNQSVIDNYQSAVT